MFKKNLSVLDLQGKPKPGRKNKATLKTLKTLKATLPKLSLALKLS